MQHHNVEAFAELPFTEQFVLWGLRLWVTGKRNGLDIRDKIEEGFSRGGVPLATDALCRLMDTVTPGLRRPLHVNCACYNRVSDDENLILNAIAQSQVGNSETVRFWLATLLPANLIPLAQATFDAFAEALIQGGIYMSQARILFNNEIHCGALTARDRVLH